MSEETQGRLAAYLARAFPGKEGLRITKVDQIRGGWESDLYAFTVESGPAGTQQSEELILRTYHGEDACEKAAREFNAMKLLRAAGYPVPRVLVLELEGSSFGSPQDRPFGEVLAGQAQGRPLDRPFVIMERIQGRMMWPELFGAPEEKQERLLTLFCGLFVQMHALAWRPFGKVLPGQAQDRHLGKVLPGGGQDSSLQQCIVAYDAGDCYAFLNRELDKARPVLERFPLPGFRPVLEWLERRRERVPCERPAIIHGDYHPGNILLGDDGSATVIDWTQVDISDPRFDLAWTLVLVSTYEGAGWHERILREYERLAGAKVERLAFFEVFACVKRLYSVAAALTFGPETVGIRPGAEAIMRQQMGASGRVYDLLVARTGIEVPEIEKLLGQNA